MKTSHQKLSRSFSTCSWSSGIDTDGLNPEDRKRIKQVGFNKWLEEVSAPKKEKRIETSKAPELPKEVAGKKLTKAQKNAVAFIAAADKNGIVTFDQAKAIDPKYPADPAFHARKMGWEVKTDKKNKQFKIGKYDIKRQRSA